MELGIERATYCVQAIVCLHNFVIDEDGGVDIMADTNDENNGLWRRENVQLDQAQIRRPNATRNKRNAEEMRNKLKEYFMNEGLVEWQMRMIS
jgi:hypothetical protein